MSKAVKIAILGSGNIGGTLGGKWSAAGHSVVFGVRDPSSPKARSALAKSSPTARLDTIANALRSGDVVVLAVPSGAVEQTISEHGAALDGKLVVDTTNRFGAPVVNHIATIAAAAPRATIYRAFNSLGWENFAEPVIEGQRADLFYCGPEGESNDVIEQLIEDVGLRPVRVGGLETAPLVDNIGSLWAALVFGRHKSRHLAFRMLGG